MRALIIVFALTGCSVGYWPVVDGPKDAKYQSDVRDCQTDAASEDRAPSKNPLMYVFFGAGGLVGGSKGIDVPKYIDECMAKRGYKVDQLKLAK